MHVHTETELDIDDSSSRAYPKQFLLYVKVYLFPIFASYYTEEWMKTSLGWNRMILEFLPQSFNRAQQ